MRHSLISFGRFVISVVVITGIILSVDMPKAKAVSARAYALIDQNSGRIILSCNADAKMPMASTTKIMTGLIAVESGRLDETITVPGEAIRVEGSSMGLVADEKITLREVVYGLMLESGNDAANTIAYVLAGSTGDFAKLMNARAIKIGLKNTHFCNPSGLSNPDHYTTAHDLATLAGVAMKNEEFAKIVSTQKIKVSYNGMKNGRTLSNHNRLLSSYNGALGVKTGFTKKSGRCLVSCAKRNDVELVVATLNDPNDWRDHAELLDSGFKTLESSQILTTSQKLSANVVGGTADTVDTVFDKTVNASLKSGEFSRVEQHAELQRFYYAPIKKGQVLGSMVYTVDGVTVAKKDITAAADVAYKVPGENVKNFFEGIFNAIGGFFKRLFGIK